MASYTSMDTQRNQRQIAARLVHASLTGSQTSTAAGIPQGYTQLSAATTGTGVYVINFLKPFARIPCVQATALSAAGKLFCVIGACTTSSVTINVFSDAGTATNVTDLHVMATGWDCADQQ